MIIFTFLLTILIESAIFLVLFLDKKSRNQILVICIVNFISYPIAIIAMILLDKLVLVEIGVILLEALLIMIFLKVSRSRAIIISLVLNGVTWAISYLF